jgi:hypothetical protein
MANEHGSLKNLFPPGNNGLQQGTGEILGSDEVTYEFNTPNGNNDTVLEVGGPVTFKVANNGKAKNVTPA